MVLGRGWSRPKRGGSERPRMARVDFDEILDMLTTRGINRVSISRETQHLRSAEPRALPYRTPLAIHCGRSAPL